VPQEIHTLSCEDAISFIDESVDGHAEVSPSGHFRWINKAYARALNAPPELILGTHWREWTHAKDIEIDQKLADAVKNGEQPGYELSKRYLQYGFPPLKPRVVWGLITVTGKWKDDIFSGYRVTFRLYEAGSRGYLEKASEVLDWGQANWKPLAAIATLVITLLFGGVENLLALLKEAQDTKQSVEQVLPSEKSSQ